MSGNLINEKRLRTKLGGVSAMFIRRLYDDLKSNFPKFVRLGRRQKFWSEQEIDAWIEARRAAQQRSARHD
jgi:predicted DNA-binding transcriptional regulator AlpA